MFRDFFQQAYITEVERGRRFLPAIWDEASLFLLGDGKRTRPELYYDACCLFRTTPNIHLALALELLHNYFCLQDDIMDQDVMRRDQPTLHAALTTRYSVNKASSLTMMIGDYLHTRVSELLHEAHMPKVLQEKWYEVMALTIQGQTAEFACTSLPTLDEIRTWYTQKTSYYSLYLPLLCAGYEVFDEMDYAQMTNIAETLGFWYQVCDDVADITGEKRKNGEGKSSDLLHGRYTPFFVLLLEYLPGEERELILQEIREKNMLSEELYARVHFMIHHIGCIPTYLQSLELECLEVMNVIHQEVYRELPLLMRLCQNMERVIERFGRVQHLSRQ